MERSRFRTLLGIGLIVLGVIFLSQALARPTIGPLHLPPLPPLPAMPALPPLPPLPALPPLPPPVPHDMPFLHDGGWFSPPLLLIGLIVLAIVWRRRAACRPTAE
jgi:hypothetical protein